MRLPELLVLVVTVVEAERNHQLVPEVLMVLMVMVIVVLVHMVVLEGSLLVEVPQVHQLTDLEVLEDMHLLVMDQAVAAVVVTLAVAVVPNMVPVVAVDLLTLTLAVV
jgi:hypothetical protein